ncbi:hypothetical protein HK103_003494 [Boothiomyces macroporosus]|uniref:Uncharacterized protein n=1 Tax=Boothiomyces macroporosus TaxID=261099 RepID=A0AAD5UHX6_9FUNG|nr:hypothetical protein HK103_003494 [Boothiomyces macroporosus]
MNLFQSNLKRFTKCVYQSRSNAIRLYSTFDYSTDLFDKFQESLKQKSPTSFGYFTKILKDLELIKQLKTEHFYTLCLLAKNESNLEQFNYILKSMEKVDLKPNTKFYLLKISLLGLCNESLELLKTVEPNHSVYNVFLKLYFKKPLDQLLQFIEMMKKEIDFNIVIYDTLINGFMEIGKRDLALEYFNQIGIDFKAKKSSNEDDLVSLLSGTDDSKQIYENKTEKKDETIGNSLKPSRYTIVTFLKLFAEDYEKQLEIFQYARNEKLVDNFVCSIMISNLTKLNKNIDIVLDYLNGRAVDPVLNQSIINYYVKRNEFDKVQEYLSKTDNSISTFTVLEGLCKNNSLSAYEFLLELNKNEKSTLVMFRTVLEHLKNDQHFDEFHFLFSQLKLEPILPIYNIMLDGCVKEFNKEMFHKYWEMLNKKMKPNQISYTKMIDMGIKSGDFEGCLKTILQMEKAKFSIKTETLLSVLKLGLITRKLKDILRLIPIIKQKNTDLQILKDYSPQFQNLLVNLFRQSQDTKLLLSIYKELVPNPSPELLLLIMDAYRKEKNLVQVIKIWSMLQTNPSDKAIEVLLQSIKELGKEQTSRTVTKMIRENSYQLNSQAQRYYFELVFKYGDLQEKKDLIFEIKEKEFDFSLQDYNVRDKQFEEFVQEYFPELHSRDE